jgi:formylglycine-generating enzyme required for sulfatase activity
MAQGAPCQQVDIDGRQVSDEDGNHNGLYEPSLDETSNFSAAEAKKCMVRVPAGEFQMDCDIHAYKVTNSEYALCVAAGACQAPQYRALDMAGNVREWVNDWHENRYYSRPDG